MNPLWRPRDQVQEIQPPPGVEALLQFQWPSLIGKILSARGFLQTEQVERLLFPKLADLKDPLSIKGMAQALERLIQAFRKDEKICIYADFDLDGTSGLALLKTGLQAL